MDTDSLTRNMPDLLNSIAVWMDEQYRMFGYTRK